MRWLFWLVLLVSCSGSTPVPVTKTAPANSQETATFYLTPDDAILGEPSFYWTHLQMQKEEGYIYKIPNASWGNLLNVEMGHQVDYWFGTSDYDRITWEWNSITEGFDYLPIGRDYSGRDTYFALWSDKTHALKIPLTYEAPDNYIYATLEQIGCVGLSIDSPTTITLWGTNLQGGQDFHIWFGFWHETYGYGRTYAYEHPDYPEGVYDIGVRNQPAGEDYVDLTNDSVYNEIGTDLTFGDGIMRGFITLMLDNIADGYKLETTSYDYLRQKGVDIPVEVPLYYVGINTWDKNAPTFSGQSGAIGNTTLMFTYHGNYVMWFAYNGVNNPHFSGTDGDIPVIVTAPIHFYVSKFQT